MIKLDVHNLQGESIGKIELPENIFNVEINDDVIYQAVNAQLANNRQNIAHTKDRGDVRGGGKKPWRQKGTGRARHGSIRSPLWRGGGATFGPRNEKNFSIKINKKIRQKALLMALTSKVRDKELIILDDIKITEPKTKLMAGIISKNFQKGNKSGILMAIPQKNENIITASKNISNLKAILADSLNVLDLLSFKYLLLDKQSVTVIEKTYGNI